MQRQLRIATTSIAVIATATGAGMIMKASLETVTKPAAVVSAPAATGAAATDPELEKLNLQAAATRAEIKATKAALKQAALKNARAAQPQAVQVMPTPNFQSDTRAEVREHEAEHENHSGHGSGHSSGHGSGHTEDDDHSGHGSGGGDDD